MVERLLEIIKQKGLSASAVEKKMGFGNGAIRRFSTNSPSVDKIIALSNFLNVSVEYILFGTENVSEQSEDVQSLVSYYNQLNEREKGIVLGRAEALAVIAAERAAEQTKNDELAADELSAPAELEPCKITYYDYPASAGTGLFLDEATGEDRSVVKTPNAMRADFAIPISGDSMEPDFSDGDVVLIESCPCVSRGEIGIFLLDGAVYFKEFGGDCLISYNKEYKPIMLKDHTSSVCLGRVLGKAEIIK